MADLTKRAPTAAFHHRDFRRYQLARLLVIMGAEAQSVAVAWQVYQLTHRALDLGFTGLALFLPGPLFMLAAGHAADRFDRRKVLLVCYAGFTACSSLLLSTAFLTAHSVRPIYAVLVLLGVLTGQPMNLIFNSFELVAMVLAVVIVNFIVQDGESNWFEGLQLLAAYAIMAIAFFLRR